MLPNRGRERLRYAPAVTARHALAAVCLGWILLVSSGALAADAPAPAVEPRVDIFEYVVDGNSVLPALDIEQAVYPFLGEQRIAADVDRAREELERRYHARGYQTVQVRIP